MFEPIKMPQFIYLGSHGFRNLQNYYLSPLDSFDISILVNRGIIFTDGFITTLAFASIILGILIVLSAIVNRYTTMEALLYESYTFFLSLFKQQVISVRGYAIYPMLWGIFLLILFLNVLNLFVYNVVLTGHLVITFFLSFSIFGSFIFIAYMNYQTFYFYFYVPKGVKSPLKEGLVGIEFLSYVIRPFSLSIRLFANILAGHTLLHIFGSFFIYVLSNYPAVVFLPIVICLAITALEIAVAFIQAYVYFTLASIYLSDSYRLH